MRARQATTLHAHPNTPVMCNPYARSASKAEHTPGRGRITLQWLLSPPLKQHDKEETITKIHKTGAVFSDLGCQMHLIGAMINQELPECLARAQNARTLCATDGTAYPKRGADLCRGAAHKQHVSNSSEMLRTVYTTRPGATLHLGSTPYSYPMAVSTIICIPAGHPEDTRSRLSRHHQWLPVVQPHC